MCKADQYSVKICLERLSALSGVHVYCRLLSQVQIPFNAPSCYTIDHKHVLVLSKILDSCVVLLYSGLSIWKGESLKLEV